MAALATRLVAASPYAGSIRVLNMRSDELTVADPGSGAARAAVLFIKFLGVNGFET